MSQPLEEPLARQVLAGAQMLFVAFGALVLMPLITGMDPNVALFTAGIGTLLFQLVTKRQVPVFLASSFAFIAPIIAAKGDFGLPAVLGGVVAAGIVYMFLGFAVRLKGPGFIDRLLPPVVIAPVIISIGLALSPVAVNMAMGKAGDGSEAEEGAEFLVAAAFLLLDVQQHDHEKEQHDDGAGIDEDLHGG